MIVMMNDDYDNDDDDDDDYDDNDDDENDDDDDFSKDDHLAPLPLIPFVRHFFGAFRLAPKPSFGKNHYFPQKEPTKLSFFTIIHYSF